MSHFRADIRPMLSYVIWLMAATRLSRPAVATAHMRDEAELFGIVERLSDRGAPSAFMGVFRAGVRDVHRAVFSRDQHTLTLAVGDIGTIVAAGLEVVQPTLARRVETTRRVDLIRRDVGSVTEKAAGAADSIRLLAPLLLLAANLAGAAALFLSADRRGTVVRLGVGDTRIWSARLDDLDVVDGAFVVRVLSLGSARRRSHLPRSATGERPRPTPERANPSPWLAPRAR